MKRLRHWTAGVTIAVLALMVSAIPSRAGDARVGDFVQAGKIRIALFLPQYAKDQATGEPQGRGTGLVGIEIARHLAAEIGVKAEFVGYPTPADVTASLKAGSSDIAFMGIEPPRTLELAFSPPVIQFDYTYLVPAGSAIKSAADADRPGVRIVFVSHHAASLALQRVVKHAALIGADLPDAAFELLRAGKADALALARPMLVPYAAKLPGSRMVEDGYGVNRLGIAMQKGNSGHLDYITEFVEQAKASGLVRRAVEQASLREIQVSPPGPAPAGQ